MNVLLSILLKMKDLKQYVVKMPGGEEAEFKDTMLFEAYLCNSPFCIKQKKQLFVLSVNCEVFITSVG